MGLLTGALPDFPWDSLAPFKRARPRAPRRHRRPVGRHAGRPDARGRPRGARGRGRRARLPADLGHARPARGRRRLVRPPPRRARPRPGRRAADDRLQGARRLAADAARASARATSSCTRAWRTPPTTSAPGWPARPRCRTDDPAARLADGAGPAGVAQLAGQPHRPGPGRRRTSRRVVAAWAAAVDGAVVVASDECYAELAWDEPWASRGVPSVLDPRVDAAVTDGAARRLLAVQAVQPRRLPGGVRRRRPGAGRRAARGAQARRDDRARGRCRRPWSSALADDAHVAEQRARYARRRDRAARRARAAGFAVDALRGRALPVGRPGPATRTAGRPSAAWPSAASSWRRARSTARRPARARRADGHRRARRRAAARLAGA